MKKLNKTEVWRRRKADASIVKPSTFIARSPLQAQRERTIAYQAALEILG